jgi:hypothetical protein
MVQGKSLQGIVIALVLVATSMVMSQAAAQTQQTTLLPGMEKAKAAAGSGGVRRGLA